MKTKTSVFCALALLACSGTVVAESGYALDAGVQFSRGDYGTDSETDMWELPLTLSYATESWGWGVTVPWLVVRGTGEVVPSGPTVVRRSQGGSGAGGGAGAAGTGTTVRTESGLGDVTLRGSVRLWEESGYLPWTGFSVEAKFGTADEERALGTGENDYSAQIELAKGVVSGFAGYRALGDPPGIDFRDVAYGGVSLTFDGGPDTRFGLDYYAEEAALAGNPDTSEGSLFFAHHLSDVRTIKGYLLKGFSDASPDWGLGVALSHFF